LVETQNILSSTSIILGLCILAFGIIMFKWKSSRNKKKTLQTTSVEKIEDTGLNSEEIKSEKNKTTVVDTSVKPEEKKETEQK
jgi:hypothetical protein